MQELARRVLLSKSGLSQLFSRPERRGLVERRGDPENLRVT
jgi:DNA-binding MarR family transcriptional regulator